MARYDKYDPISGGFRAALAADWADADCGIPFAVGLDTNGRVVKGAGTTGVVGVLVVDGMVGPTGTRVSNKKATNIVDVMTAGEISDCTLSDGTTALDPGTKYFGEAAATGLLTATATANYAIGWAVDTSRLVVRTGGRAAGG
jgi:hypothetical protein